MGLLLSTLNHNALIEELCTRYATQSAFITADGQQVTYETLLQTVRSFAAKLRSEGVGVGHLVAPFTENPVVYHALSLAVLRVGGTLAIVSSADDAIRHGLNIDFAITLPDAPSVLARNIVFDQSWFGIVGDDRISPTERYVISSSGTTGKPKYYLCDQAWMKSWLNISDQSPSEAGTKTLITLPTAGAYGYYLVVKALVSGSTIIRSKSSALATLDSIVEYDRVKIMSTPAAMSDFLDTIENGASAPKNVDHIQLGGSSVTQRLAAKIEDVFGCHLTNGFGSCEAGFCAVERPAIEQVEQGFVGWPIEGTKFKIEDENGAEAPIGEVGILAVLPPVETQVKTVLGTHPYDDDGWFRSGDLGYIRADGALILTGRNSDLINSSGAKVAPAKYERLVLRMIEATQVAAFGVPNALGSEDVGVAIVCNANIDLQDIRKRMIAEVGTHLDIHVFRLDKLPVNANGKVDRKQILQVFLDDTSTQ